ncbi:MAG: hypothetical protein DWQ37_08915 [Planctomycetota bacterium]|nr:MAG: hypothetical protein DWQ37_08915 [Planctomycetota bacterium]
MNHALRSIRKAAVLLASLEPSQAEELLRELSPAQADALRREVDALGSIDLAERGDVIQEFVRVGPLLPAGNPAGIELDAPLPQSMTAAMSAQPAARDGRSFQFLHDAGLPDLVAFLEREHPQTVAVVLSHLPASRAAEILAQLSNELQADVARRLVALDSADPEVVREVEQGLQAWLNTPREMPSGEGPGIAALVEILGAAVPSARDAILSNLSRHDRTLAERLEPPAPPPLSFADLTHLDSTALSVVLRHANDGLLRLALADASPGFVEQVVSLLDAPAAAALRAALRSWGPTRLADVEEAQRQLAELVGQLVRRGEIAPDLCGRLSIAV